MASHSFTAQGYDAARAKQPCVAPEGLSKWQLLFWTEGWNGYHRQQEEQGTLGRLSKEAIRKLTMKRIDE